MEKDVWPVKLDSWEVEEVEDTLGVEVEVEVEAGGNRVKGVTTVVKTKLGEIVVVIAAAAENVVKNWQLY